MLFRNNAKMAERTGFPTLGVLKPGAAADVIVMDYKPSHRSLMPTSTGTCSSA